MKIFIVIISGFVYTTLLGQIKADPLPFQGKWSKTSGSAPQYLNGTLVNFANFGFTRSQYDFKPDSTYIFHSESKQSSNAYILTDEEGRYLVVNNELTIAPEKCVAKMLDANGALKETRVITSGKRYYTWQMVYFEGIDETQFVLTAAQENFIDGGFSANNAYPNSFMYGNKTEPEWQFPAEQNSND
ncbi:MAG: hypothetical protein JNK79_18830 [Chitinophagaceae bacterium]|nr:hypothetical protein [Chitinophagaceae bacterium]